MGTKRGKKSISKKSISKKKISKRNKFSKSISKKSISRKNSSHHRTSSQKKGGKRNKKTTVQGTKGAKMPLQVSFKPNAPRHGTENTFYPAQEQGILKDDTPEEKELHAKVGEDDEDIYDQKGRDLLEEDDEIQPWEEGFMEGASGPGQLGKDALTGEPLRSNVVELELAGKTYRFVNRENAQKFKEKKVKERKRVKED